MARELIVTLGAPDGRTRDLAYTVRDSAAARIWSESLEADHAKGLLDTHRLYYFPGQEEADRDRAFNQLDAHLATIRRLRPDLALPSVPRENPSEAMNFLHANFVHDHHAENETHPDVRAAWTAINLLIHEIEGFKSIADVKERTGGMGQAQIYFTWKNATHRPIPEDSYRDFTIGHEFGAAYIAYCHVGRHLYEMFTSGDDSVPDDQIQPQRLITGNTFLWFGFTTGDFGTKVQTDRVRAWFDQRAARFAKLGLAWGDPKLSLGYIPVASLKDRVFTTREALRLATELAPFRTVLDARCR